MCRTLLLDQQRNLIFNILYLFTKTYKKVYKLVLFFFLFEESIVGDQRGKSAACGRMILPSTMRSLHQKSRGGIRFLVERDPESGSGVLNAEREGVLSSIVCSESKSSSRSTFLERTFFENAARKN